VDGASTLPQWIFLYGTLILYLAIGLVGLLRFHRRTTAEPDPPRPPVARAAAAGQPDETGTP